MKVKREENVTTNHVSQHDDSRNKTYRQVLNVYISDRQTSIPTAALLDSGSDSTLISSDLADKRNLQGKTKDISLTNVLSMSNKMKSKLVSFSISSCSHPQPLQIKNAWVVQDLQPSPFPVTVSSVKRKYSHLSEIPFDSPQDKDIEILIGADHPNLHLYTEIKSGNNNKPAALHTTLGWVLFGGNQSSPACSITNKLALDTSTDNLIQKFCDIKWYGIKPKDEINMMTVNNKRVMEILEKTTTKFENRYVVGLLWKEDNVLLPNNKPLALSRLYSLEKNLKKIKK